jgi:flagellar export protein FliJ
MARNDHRAFDTLQRVRQREEDRCAQRLAEARRDVAAAERQRAMLQAQTRATLEAAGSHATDHLDASELRRYYQYERHLARLTDAKDAEIRHLEGVSEERRAALEEAMKARRVVEKLRERKLLARRKRMRDLEQRLLDEVAINYARPMNPGANPAEEDSGS